MSARRFVAMVETLLVDLYGSEPVEEWLAAGERDEVAQRRRENALAALMVGGEVG